MIEDHHDFEKEEKEKLLKAKEEEQRRITREAE